MSQVSVHEIQRRRLIEDELIRLGSELERLAQEDAWNRARIRRLIEPAREVGITVRDMARMTGLSTQTLHTWKEDLMRLIPDIHYGLAGPTPITLEQAVLRTMGEDIRHDWTAAEVHQRIPPGWPTGSSAEIGEAMEQLARWHMVWDGDENDRYRVAPPAYD
jgi:hypothetical protein